MIELLVVVGIIAVLAALLLPALQKAKESAKKIGYQGPMPITASTPSLGNLEIRGGKTYKTQADTTTRNANPYFCPATRGMAHSGNGADPDDPTGVYGVWYDWPSPDIFCDYGMNLRIGGTWSCPANNWDVGGTGKLLKDGRANRPNLIYVEDPQ